MKAALFMYYFFVHCKKLSVPEKCVTSNDRMNKINCPGNEVQKNVRGQISGNISMFA
jgi:hypothetical protein